MADNLNKALQICIEEYYFLYFWIVRTWFSMINLTYSLISGKWDFILEYQGHMSWTGRFHIVGGHILSSGSWIVLPRSWQDSFLHVFFLLCLFAIVDLVGWLPCAIMELVHLLSRLCILVGLTQSHIGHACSLNCNKQFMHHFSHIVVSCTCLSVSHGSVTCYT